MSKITFRADDDLVDRVESLDASKSEVMRAALRSYLDADADADADADVGAASGASGSLDEMVAERVDDIVAARVGDRSSARDVNVNITVETTEAGGVEASVDRGREQRPARDAPSDGGTCSQCGEALSNDHVFCPNCGEKAARRLFCECGDELRSDWSHCPSCGRRTASADVLDG
jgi:predicted transcriptional regulator/RNA polymerase subunit RPABC4/transcription elongation factor Spt4